MHTLLGFRQRLQLKEQDPAASMGGSATFLGFLLNPTQGAPRAPGVQRSLGAHRCEPAALPTHRTGGSAARRRDAMIPRNGGDSAARGYPGLYFLEGGFKRTSTLVWGVPHFGCGSIIGAQNGTLVTGKVD